MSIPFSGTIKRSAGITLAISKQLERLSLKPVKKVFFKFDPFHEKIEQTRYFLYHISTGYVLQTNSSCRIKTEITCDRSDPSVTFKLVNDEEVIFKSANLTALEMLRLYNKHITVLDPKPTETEPVQQTKLVKKGAGSKRVGKKN